MGSLLRTQSGAFDSHTVQAVFPENRFEGYPSDAIMKLGISPYMIHPTTIRCNSVAPHYILKPRGPGEVTKGLYLLYAGGIQREKDTLEHFFYGLFVFCKRKNTYDGLLNAAMKHRPHVPFEDANKWCKLLSQIPAHLYNCHKKTTSPSLRTRERAFLSMKNAIHAHVKVFTVNPIVL